MTRLTRQEILQAAPGQQLDAWVAEYVLGWQWQHGDHYDICSGTGRQLHLLDRGESIDAQCPGEFFLYPGDEQFAPFWDQVQGKTIRPTIPEGQFVRILWSHMPESSTDWNDAMRVRSKLTGSQFSRFVNHLYEITGRIAAADKRGDIALFSTLEPFIVCQAALLAVCGGDETNKEMK